MSRQEPIVSEPDGRPGRLTEAEIASQPEMWERAMGDAGLVADMPDRTSPVLVLGCGTSYYIGDSWARLRNASGAARTRAEIPSELSWLDPDETIVLLSRSGTTGDLIRAAERLRDGHRLIAVVGTPGTPVDQVAHASVHLDFADERSVMQTRFATTALVFLRRVIDRAPPSLVDEARRAVAAPLPLGDHDHLVFLGTGPSSGLAQEAALKCREAAGVWVEAYPVREYEHGPIAAAGGRTLVWALAPVDARLRGAIEATGATLHESDRDPLAELIVAQRAAVALARRAGRDPDRPEHLSRSVITA